MAILSPIASCFSLIFLSSSACHDLTCNALPHLGFRKAFDEGRHLLVLREKDLVLLLVAILLLSKAFKLSSELRSPSSLRHLR